MSPLIDDPAAARTARKPTYLVSPALRAYLAGHGRELALPVSYSRLVRNLRQSR